ncbi:hypothetical protein AX769_16755 [Frondihabitans sp. PAMC 28766]|uniref:MarR family transcriptional regulator n=1 Tax=Frondihabitans sp. PAMC 28766 TaxID=1795630 RepID=UPI00078B9B25|nr:MarR family transcriptional regulator [Frondihabitans sp. PAMC 28766]AMM21484.1 hypothetical protein AX769_16755 [Frondihabitans sp. PAMC 28766]
MDSTPPLRDDELALWHAFKGASEAVTAAVEKEIQDAAGLTGAEFGVLDRLRLHEGAMRQVDLARSLGWQKSRLSHQLARMQERDLVVRHSSGPSNAMAQLTAPGRAAIAAALPAHARAVRAHLVEAVAPELRATVLEILLAAGRA